MRACARCPLVAIGGIDAATPRSVRAAGAAGFAVISAVAGAAEPEAATRALVAAWRRRRGARVSDAGLRAVSAAGLLRLMLALAWAFSLDRRRVPWRVVGWGLALQLGLGVLLLETPVGRVFFVGMNAVVSALGSYTDAGARFVFGSLLDTGFSFAVNVLPIIVFMGSLFAVLYHLGVHAARGGRARRRCSRARSAPRARRASRPSRTSSSA